LKGHPVTFFFPTFAIPPRESSKATHQSDEEEGALIGGGDGGGSWLAIRHGLGSHPDCGLNLRLVYEYMGPIILIRTRCDSGL
jgi:hypothetical protein